MLAALLIPAIVAPSLTSGLHLYLLSFPILGILALVTLGPFMRRTEQRKQNWLNEYGWHVLAPISRYPEENAFIIGGLARGRDAFYYRYVNWQDPETGQIYAFPVNTRFFSALRNQPEGSLHPVWFDPEDPSFFIVSTERR
ncbi:MAG TPA: hypothetical protein VFU49_14565 [Ktedonobacteraceae bacterium]|nr:hypothetical protein [Ktedonobacteraceae bacterium]